MQDKLRIRQKFIVTPLPPLVPLAAMAIWRR
jgi:hypothetical protein